MLLQAFLSFLVCVALSSPSSANKSSRPDIGAILLCPAVGLLIGGALWFLGNREQHMVVKQEIIERLENASHAQQQAYEQAVDARNKQIAGYHRATQNWNNLYYCYRDDCVYVPGAGKSASVNELQNYLYSV